MSGKNKIASASVDRIIDDIMQILELLPETRTGLKKNLDKRSFWEKQLKQGSYDRPGFQDVLQEMPLFTILRPAKPTAAAWRKLFSSHMGPCQFTTFLNQLANYVTTKPIKLAKPKNWRDAFQGGNFQRFRPEESNEYLHNPHRGTTTFQRFQGDDVYPTFITSDAYAPKFFPKAGGRIKENAAYVPRTTLSYCRCLWAKLEPEKGKYNWEYMDKLLVAAKNCGQTLQFRFQPYTGVDFETVPDQKKLYPEGKFVNVPYWYWRTGAKTLFNPLHFGGSDTIIPDDNDPLYLKHFGEFVKAYAKRYDGHPDLESIDVSYAGFWGEGGGVCTPETAAKLIDVYAKAFKKTQLIYPLGTHGLYYASKKAAQKGGHVAWRADCFGDIFGFEWPNVRLVAPWMHHYDCYPREIAESGLEDAWKTQPVTMETCGNVGTWGNDDLDIDRIIHDGYNYHMTVFMPKSVFYPKKMLDKLIEFDKKIGYRFVLRQITAPVEAKAGGKIELSLFFDNVGCAPIYRDYKLAFKFTQGKKSAVVKLKKDIRTLMPGNNWFAEKVTVPANFAAGDVKVSFGIVNDADKVVVFLANKGKLEDGWLPSFMLDLKK